MSGESAVPYGQTGIPQCPTCGRDIEQCGRQHDEEDPVVSRYGMLEVWVALGGDINDFVEWMSDPKRTPADAWAQLLAAVRGDLMEGDHNPEPGLILSLVRTS